MREAWVDEDYPGPGVMRVLLKVDTGDDEREIDARDVEFRGTTGGQAAIEAMRQAIYSAEAVAEFSTKVYVTSARKPLILDADPVEIATALAGASAAIGAYRVVDRRGKLTGEKLWLNSRRVVSVVTAARVARSTLYPARPGFTAGAGRSIYG